MIKEKEESRKEFIFTDISIDLDFEIKNNCGFIEQKGIFPTQMNRGIKVFIYSGDHLPIHFHVRSSQRYLNAKFAVDPLELIENKTVIKIAKDERFIIKYFTKNKHLLDEISDKFIELNPNLKYDKK